MAETATEYPLSEQLKGAEQAKEAARAEISSFEDRLREQYGNLSDRELLLMVVGWQLNANKQIKGLVEQGQKLMANPMIAQMMGMLD